MIKKRDIEDLDEDLWLLETKVRTMRFGLVLMLILLEAALFIAAFALMEATGMPLI